MEKNNVKENVNRLTNKCWMLREKNSDSALIYGKEALMISEEIGYNEGIARASGFVGVVYIHYLHQARQSIPYFQKSMEYGLLVNDSVQLGYAYNNLGDAFMLTGNALLAFQYGGRSLEIFKKLKHQLGIAYGYINLGLTHRMENNFEEALINFEEAKRIRKKVNDKIGLASVEYEMAIVYEKQKKFKLALEKYRKSLRLHQEIENVKYGAYCLNGIANIYYLTGRFDSALYYYQRAYKLNTEKNLNYGLIDNYIGLALVYAQKGKVEEGEYDLACAMNLSKKMAIPSKILKTHESYTEFYKIVGNYQKATNSLDAFLHLYDSLLRIQKFEALNELQNSFYVNQNLAQTKNELESRKQERNYLLVIIVLLAMVFAAIVWRMISQRRLNKQLNAINLHKNKLFSVISHDLRTPFNSMLGFSELLLDDIKNNQSEDLEKYAALLNKSANDTYKLLNNLLDWSRAQTGKMQFNPQAILPTEIFKHLKENLTSEADSVGIRLKFESLLTEKVLLDADILYIVLNNLILNAIKFSEQGKEIIIRAEEKHSKLIFSVIDQGVGMPDEVLENLWNPELSISNPGVRNEKGTGLGLTICKDLVRMHQGKIDAKSKLGKGSTFKVEIPYLID